MWHVAWIASNDTSKATPATHTNPELNSGFVGPIHLAMIPCHLQGLVDENRANGQFVLTGSQLIGTEIKSASTWHASFKRALEAFRDKIHPLAKRSVVYSGKAIAFSDGIRAVCYKDTRSLFD